MHVVKNNSRWNNENKKI